MSDGGRTVPVTGILSYINAERNDVVDGEGRLFRLHVGEETNDASVRRSLVRILCVVAPPFNNVSIFNNHWKRLIRQRLQVYQDEVSE